MGILGSIASFPGFTWVKAHEKLLIVVIVVLAGLHFWSVGVNEWEKHEQRQFTAMQNQLAADKTAAAQADADRTAAATAAAADKAAMQQVLTTVQAQNASLIAAINARDKATASQQQVDLHASISDLSTRFSALVPGVQATDMAISKDGKTVTVGTDTAEKTVAQLELVPGLQADLKDTQSQITGLNSEIKSLQTFNTALETEVATDDKEIGLLNKELADADKTCQAQVNLEKAKGKKSFLKGLRIGAVAGFIAGLFVGHGGI
jgi:hypothetical protein